MSVNIWVKGAPETAPALNLSNSNFKNILEALGFETDWAGDLNPHQLKKAIDAMNPNPEAAQMHHEALVTHGIMSTGGPGYYDQRLIQLREVAEYAIAHNQEVRYG